MSRLRWSARLGRLAACVGRTARRGARWLRGLAGRLRSWLSWRRHEARKRRLARPEGRELGPRVAAIGAWSVPCYSQAFVYQELLALAAGGFQVRLCHSVGGGRGELAPRFAALRGWLWRLETDPGAGARSLARWRRLAPARLDDLLAELAAAAGVAPEAVVGAPGFRRGLLFADLAAAWRADWLHSYFFYEGTLAAHVAARLLDLPRGITCYADHLLADHPWKLVHLHLRAADLLVATSSRIAGELASLLPSAAPRIVVKPNAIDCAAFPDRLSAPRPGPPWRLLAVCRIDAKKGLPDAVEALAELRRSGHDVRLEVAGDADPTPPGRRAREELLAAIRHHSLGGRVHLLGRCGERRLRRALAAAHLFLAPSIELEGGDKDGIPTSLLEAMATGLPVVATRAGSIPEAVRHGVDGWLVESRRPDLLAAGIAGLLADAGLRERLGRAAAAAARERYDVTVCEPLLHAAIRGRLAESRVVPER